MPDSGPAPVPTGWSTHVVDADTGEVLLSEHADAVRRTASVAKVLALTALAEALEAGEVSREEVLSRTTTPRVADSGLWHLLDVEALPVGDVATLVGAVSDNWATNVLLTRLGLEAVQTVAPRAALVETQLWDLVRDERGPEQPPTLSSGTAREWCSVFVRLHAGTWFTPAVTARVLGWLGAGVDHSMVAGGFGLDPLVGPTGPVRVVNKTGTDDGVRADVGLAAGPARTMAYACLWNGPDAGVGDVLARMRGLGATMRGWAE